jgi:hypothetical protein
MLKSIATSLGITIAVVLATIMGANNAHAAKITQNADTIFYVGKVLDGDAERLEAVLRTTHVRKVSMSSRGGVATEGYKLGYLFKEYEVSAYIASDQHCISACAVAILGAPQKDINGLLGFHVAWTKSKGTMSEGMRQGQSLATLDTIYNFRVGYGVHLQYLIANYTASDTFLILSQEDLEKFEFSDPSEYADSAGITTEWLEKRIAGPTRMRLKMSSL